MPGFNNETRHEDGSVMIWAAMSWYSVGRIVTPLGRITARVYVDKLGKQVHPII